MLCVGGPVAVNAVRAKDLIRSGHKWSGMIRLALEHNLLLPVRTVDMHHHKAVAIVDHGQCHRSSKWSVYVLLITHHVQTVSVTDQPVNAFSLTTIVKRSKVSNLDLC